MVKRVRRVPRLPARPVDGHKGTFGTVVSIAGSPGMLGAAILCARGALRGGAGLVRCVVPRAQRDALTIAVPPATTFAREAEPRTWFERCDAVVCGPGLPVRATARKLARAAFLHTRRGAVPVVLDAGAVTSGLFDQPLPAPERTVFTPHPGEAATVLGCSTAEVQEDRERAAQSLVDRAGGGVCVLKGAGTLVTDGERLYVNTTGNAGLGTGGSGDVLSGLLGALCAQGMAPFDAAVLGVHVHGLAGDLVAERLSAPGLCADDLPVAIAEVLGR